MEEYKSNSYKSKEQTEVPEEKKIQKVANGKTRKKSELSKFADVFISEDVQSVKSYILMDVLVPAIKKAISDIVANGIDMLLYGESGRTKSSSPGSRISYANCYDRNSSRRETTARTRSVFDYDDIIFEKRGEAEDVLSRMDELISTYHMASVADLFEFAGLTGPYTGNRYGWTDIRSASVVRTKDGYMLKLPRALPLDEKL